MNMKFDIILPTVGRSSVNAAIDSVLEQDYQHFALWVICDGIKREELGWPYVKNPRLNGRGGILDSLLPWHNDSGAWARNEGIRCGNNPWIAYIDDDDIWRSHHLSTLVALHKEHPEATMLRTVGQQFCFKRKSPRSKERVRKLLQTNSEDILTVGMAHTRELFEKTTGWKHVDNHDRILWYEMLGAGGIAVEDGGVTFEFAK